MSRETNVEIFKDTERTVRENKTLIESVENTIKKQNSIISNPATMTRSQAASSMLTILLIPIPTLVPPYPPICSLIVRIMRLMEKTRAEIGTCLFIKK